MHIDQLIQIFRKRFAIPNLILCIGIFFVLAKLLLIWFGSSKELKVKSPKINPTKEDSFFMKRDILLSDYEIIPNKNLFRSSRTEWVPPAPLSSSPPAPPPAAPISPPPPVSLIPPSPLSSAPPPPSPPPPRSPFISSTLLSLLPPPLIPSSSPTPSKPVPPPQLTISAIVSGGEHTSRAIFEGKYFIPPKMKKMDIKRKGYKLQDKFGQYKIAAIDRDKVVLTDPGGNIYEFYQDKYKAIKKRLFNKPKKLKAKFSFGIAPSHISGAKTEKAQQSDFSLQHISGAKTKIPQHISGNKQR